eukprot:5260388-Amphidinium_carterae.2
MRMAGHSRASKFSGNFKGPKVGRSVSSRSQSSMASEALVGSHYCCWQGSSAIALVGEAHNMGQRPVSQSDEYFRFRKPAYKSGTPLWHHFCKFGNVNVKYSQWLEPKAEACETSKADARVDMKHEDNFILPEHRMKEETNRNNIDNIDYGDCDDLPIIATKSGTHDANENKLFDGVVKAIENTRQNQGLCYTQIDACGAKQRECAYREQGPAQFRPDDGV